MKLSQLLTALLPLLHATPSLSACTSNLLIDDYAKYTSNTNSLGQWTSDDSTTTNLKADTVNKKISFTSKSGSYFYTTFSCLAATTNKYNAFTFPIKGPVGAKVTLELQTSSSCSTAYKSYTFDVTGLTGSMQTITVPLSKFTGANPNAIQGLVFGTFSINGAWEIGQTQLVCQNSAAGSTTISSTTSKPSSASKSITPASVSQSTLRPSVVKPVTSSAASTPTGACTSLLVDDFASQSRLTFLFYNAMLNPSSDDGTMKAVAGRPDTATSVIVANNHLTLTPADASSYWYTNTGCVKATNFYGGIGMTIKAPKGTTLGIEIQTSKDCNTNSPVFNDVSSTDLGWAFDGTEKYYTIPFSKFPGVDADHIVTLLFSSLSTAVTFGPIAFYCGNTGSAYPIPTTAEVIQPSSTVAATTGPSAYVVDTFTNADNNNLGFYHGGDDTTTYKIAAGKLAINTKGNSDLSWYTQLTNGCTNLTPNDNGYVHIAYTGSSAFTISLLQHNPTCNDAVAPYPATWDSVEGSRYSNSGKTDIYVPLSHFKIDRTKTIGFSLKGFYTTQSTVFSKIEIVKTVPNGFLVPSKLATAPLVFSCTRPNSFAFAIDDGSPEYAARVVKSIADAGIKVTFFTVGAPLLDPSTNLSTVYNNMLSLGHQMALHSYTHPPMEGLPTLAAIDWELNQDIAAVKKTLGISSTYFRPPFGTEGARIRQRLAAVIPGSKFIAWSVDVQDYLWAQSPTPEKQLAAFQADVDKGGNLVVMHYLYESTVNYIPQFIAIAKKTKKQLMRVDQCLEDPNAPPL
ncbi:hypothetical protein PVAG01_03335 [Phlyctema vagabunda]|uniref:NodB homology domain-containing protein n=1 Tax=Phlyctema vagabunda TaxID=108571 RepID=A0ABR4PL37_9HELO